MPFAAHFSRRGVLTWAGGAVAYFAQVGRSRAQFGPTGFHVLRARNSTAHLRGEDQAPTPVWAWGETVPGPTLRVRRADELRARVFNDLDQPIAVHWHGVRLPNAMDGVPNLTQASIAPGQNFNYRFRPPDAGTFLYRPTGDGGVQSRRGLYGVLIVGEQEKIEVDRDLVLVFDEWRLTPDGAIDTTPAAGAGGHLTVNSLPRLDLPVRSNERLRLRLVNAASRVFSLRFERHPIRVMAIDGQPAEPFVARDHRVSLGPGNRIDVFLDTPLAPGATAAVLVANAGAERPLVRLVYGPDSLRDAPMAEPKALPSNPLPERIDLKGAHRQNLPIDVPANGGPPLHQRPPLFSVRRGRPVVLALGNRTDAGSAVHLHGHHVRLLDRLDDGWKPFWLDTVLVGAGQTERVAFLADNPGKWLIDCRVLGRIGGTATWFEVN